MNDTQTLIDNGRIDKAEARRIVEREAAKASTDAIQRLAARLLIVGAVAIVLPILGLAAVLFAWAWHIIT